MGDDLDIFYMVDELRALEAQELRNCRLQLIAALREHERILIYEKIRSTIADCDITSEDLIAILACLYGDAPLITRK